jgi:hypothetical protein
VTLQKSFVSSARSAGILVLLCAAHTAQAQPPAASPRAEQPASADSIRTLDVSDVFHLVLHPDSERLAPQNSRRFIVATPSIGSKPSTGFSAGFSSTTAFYSGEPGTTHISSVSGGLKVSQLGQKTSGVKLNIFTPDDRWVIQSDNRLQWTSANIYDLGGDALATDALKLKYDYFRLNESAYRRVESGLFVGGGLNVSTHTNVEPGGSASAIPDQAAYAAYSAAHGFALGSQTSSGTSVGVLYDTRDNSINADHGVFANAVYRTYFSGFLGGDSTWQSMNLDMRTYLPLTHDARHKLAFWFLGNLVTGGTAPFLDLPETSFDGRSARGYGEGRYRGEHLLYGEVEYRGALTSNGLLGVVAFLNTTTVDNLATGEKLFDSMAPGAGFGFRVLLNKRSRTNLCTDWGWGKDGSRGFYLAIQEAF